MLCQICKGIFESPDEIGWTKPQSQDAGKHHQTREQLLHAVEVDGCMLCSSLLSSEILDIHGALVNVRRSNTSERQSLQPLLTYEWDRYLQGSLSPSKCPVLRFRSCYSEVDADCHEFALMPSELLRCNDSYWSDSHCLANPHESPLGDTNLREPNWISLALRWLQTCLDEHNDCGRQESRLRAPSAAQTTRALLHGMSGRWFPKRLIDIGPDDEKLRIIETSETLPTGPYASFSHCWGKQPDFFILTAENLAEVKHRIPLELLAPNFRDAVKTSRCLGIRYLWIDSLCILQRGEGSGKDWTEHMVAMRDVYACCVLNISADRAAGAKDGFLGSHSLNLGSPVLVNHPTLPLHRLVDLGLAHTCLGRSPLAKRAWVFQERWLSPRILHFTAYQVFWECHTRRLACEAFPDHCPTNADCNAYSGDSTQEDHRWSPTMAPFAQDWLALKDRHGWYQILEEYTSRQLSFPSKDKFHALAGVVKQVQQRWPDEYIARLFRSDLPLALLWGIDPDRIVSDVDLMPLKPNGSAYRGPSWSWTAHDRSLTYSLARACLAEGKNVTYAEVINASVLPADPNNLLGPVLSAQLLIRGHVCNARWGSNGHKAKSAGRLELMRKDGSSMSHKCEYEAALDNPNMSEHSDLWPDGMIILLVAEVMGKHIFFRDAGLLLVPDSSSDREIGQKWRRIGVWMNHRNDEESAAAVMGSVEPSMLTIV